LASSSSEPLFRLIARGEIELEGEVIESKLPLMRQGEPAWIETEDGDRVQGVVRTSYPEVDKASRLGKVRVSLFPDPRFRIGSFARGGIEVARARAVTIPQASVLYGDDRRTTVLVVGPGDKVEARDVRIGMTNDSEVQVRSGLALGERVVARAGSFLRDGDRIRPIMIAAKEAAVSVAPTTTSVARNP